MKILMVLTSNDKLGDTGKQTDFWLEEFAAPYYVFIDAGAQVTLASPPPGGHGPPWDLAVDANSIKLIEVFACANPPVAAVCHAPAELKYPNGADGKSLVSGKTVTGFTHTEEEGAGLADVVPFLAENMLRANHGKYKERVHRGLSGQFKRFQLGRACRKEAPDVL